MIADAAMSLSSVSVITNASQLPISRLISVIDTTLNRQKLTDQTKY